ncbi:hypothetical protein A2160_03405 [Candidatus Beckwithbacteria bacterium RBG_13_42_9]|uniref:Iron hydrogenase large subunit C-terminal domain-containing protein n=1 Tax=Candidatus Beckwithbacteria bacterium RBG_13_42_9 TaxID=1797457 RepID=A0A1F5E8V5_9BACT|nr:MAG: hypothetical protein A2160_03405 [Candidatus Beckwithbacteria bacterium RBG_13_42_9]
MEGQGVSEEVEQLLNLFNQKQPLVAMLAPSFPIVFAYPQIIGKLKRTGFSYMVEVAAGAKRTNEQVIELLKKNPEGRFMTSPCASFMRMVKEKYRHLMRYLAFTADSPMAATAKIVREKYPGYRPVFIGPCIVKKLEAKENYPELNILVLTYKEMNEVFAKLGINDDPADAQATFDISCSQTRLYPVSGGLTESSGARDLLAEDSIEVVSGWQNCQEAIERFVKNQDIRLLDILFCEGGCINGPGIISSLSTDERRKKIINFWESKKL